MKYYTLFFLSFISSLAQAMEHPDEEESSPPKPVISSADVGTSQALVLYRKKHVPKQFLDNFFDRRWGSSTISYGPIDFFGLGQQSETKITQYYPIQRPGGVGPWQTIEVSRYAKSLSIFTSLEMIHPDGGPSIHNFVFDCRTGIAYVEVIPRTKAHSYMRNNCKVSQPVGGSLCRIGKNLFRSNESSGHFGHYWTDKRRFQFIEAFAALGIEVIHEPWIRDSLRRPLWGEETWDKIQEFKPVDTDALPKVTAEEIFKTMSVDQLRFYQKNFLRRFNSFLNPRAFVVAHFLPSWDTDRAEKYRRSKYYEETTKSPDERFSFQVKKQYREWGKLDLEFDTDDKYFTPDDVESILWPLPTS